MNLDEKIQKVYDDENVSGFRLVKSRNLYLLEYTYYDGKSYITKKEIYSRKTKHKIEKHDISE